MPTTRSITMAEQLLEAADLDRCELIRGSLIMMSPSGFRHGRIAGAICALLRVFVQEHRLGVVTGAETGFQIAHDPDTVRAPDVGFVRGERIPETEPLGFFQGAPDLAVEVLSPTDRASEVLAKVQDWLGAGCSSVWVVDPETRTVTVYRSRDQMAVVTASEVLDAADILPGFRLPVTDIFA